MKTMNKCGVLGRFFNHIYVSFIPNNKDNLKQILIKVVFIVSFVAMIVSAVYISFYFINAGKQNTIVDRSREIWHNNEISSDSAYTDRNSLLLAENPDFRFIVSNTTVSGIVFSEEDKITDAPPKSFPAKLTLLLLRRYELGLDGFILLPCELID